MSVFKAHFVINDKSMGLLVYLIDKVWKNEKCFEVERENCCGSYALWKSALNRNGSMVSVCTTITEPPAAKLHTFCSLVLK